MLEDRGAGRLRRSENPPEREARRRFATHRQVRRDEIAATVYRIVRAARRISGLLNGFLDVLMATKTSPPAPVGLQLAEEHLFDAVVIRDRSQYRRIRGERHRREPGTIEGKATDEFSRQMLNISRAAPFSANRIRRPSSRDLAHSSAARAIVATRSGSATIRRFTAIASSI